MEIKKIIGIIVSVKIFLFLIIVGAFFLLPFSQTSYQSNFRNPDYPAVSLSSSFMTWDAQHYLFLSKHGYRPNQESDRFYPLFPGIIRLGSLVTGNQFLGSMLTANILSLAGILLLYIFVKDRFRDSDIALKSVILFLAFPTAFYLSLIYSESLFFFLVMCFFFFLYKKKFFLAGLFSFFLPLTRPVGIFILLPFTLFYGQYVYSFLSHKKPFSQKELVLKGLNLFWPILGLLSLFLFMYFKVGNPFETFILDKTVVGRWDAWSVFNPFIFLRSLFQFPLAVHGFTNSILDRVFFIGFICSIPLLYKKLDKTLFLYAILMGCIPLFGSFMSYTRYVLMAFPLCIALAVFFSQRKNTYLFIAFLFLSLMLQTFFLIMHSLNYWVS